MAFNRSTRVIALLMLTLAGSALANNYYILGDSQQYASTSIYPGQIGYPNSFGVCYQMVGKPANATWSVNGNTSTYGTFTWTNGPNNQIVVNTRGIGVTQSTGSTTQYIEFAYAISSACPAQGSSTGWTDFNYFVVDPALTITSPTSTPVALQPPNTSSTANVTVNVNPAAAGLQINGTCSVSNGASISPTTLSVATDGSGNATFPVITASNLVRVGSTAASASCTFTTGSTDQPNASKTLNFQTFAFDPTFSFSPSPVTLSGTTTVNVTASPMYQGWPINGSCTWTNPPAGSSVTIASPSSVASTPVFSNLPMGSGQASFNIATTKLDFLDPNVNATQSPYCTFQVTGGSFPGNLPITTGNQCSSALGLSPRPPGC